MTTLKHILSRKLVLLAMIVAVKLSLYFLFAAGKKEIQFKSYGFIDCPDRLEYLEPINNYVEHGNYSLTPEGEPYAGRLPGFLLPYLLFRLFFTADVSVLLLGTFIFCASVIAGYALVTLFKKITNSLLLCLFGLVSLEIIPYFWHWDFTLHPNSFAASCLIFQIYFLTRYLETFRLNYIFLTGLFAMWVFMLRGFTFIFIPVLIVCVLAALRQENISFRKILQHLSVLLLPLCIAETAWVSRNFNTFKKFIPLQTSFVPGANSPNTEYSYGSTTKYSFIKIRELINCWGGDNFWYFKNADLAWFVNRTITTPAEQQFDPNIFTGSITPENLQLLKNDAIYSLSNTISLAQHDSIETLIVKKSEAYYAEFKSTKAGYYYFISPFKRFKNFLIKNTTQDWPGPSFANASLVQKAMRVLSLLLYAVNLLLFFLLFILRFRTVFREPLHAFLGLTVISIIALFMFVINAAHYNYFIYGFIPCVIFNICLLNTFLKRKNNFSPHAGLAVK